MMAIFALLLVLVIILMISASKSNVPEPLFIVHREQLLQQSRPREPMSIGQVREPMSIGQVREPMSIGQVREPMTPRPVGVILPKEKLLQQKVPESFVQNKPIAVIMPASVKPVPIKSREERLLQRPGEVISSVPRWNEGFLARASTGGSVLIDVVDMPKNYAPYIPPSSPPPSIETLQTRYLTNFVDQDGRVALVTPRDRLNPNIPTLNSATWSPIDPTIGSMISPAVDSSTAIEPFFQSLKPTPPLPIEACIGRMQTESSSRESFESPNVMTQSQFSILTPNLSSTQMANSTFNYGNLVPRYLPNLPMMDNVDRTLLVNAALMPRRAELWFATWCGYCRTMRPIWDQVKADIKSIPGNQFAFSEFDIDKVPNEYVTKFPTIFLIDENNKRYRYSGQQDYVALRTFLLAPSHLD